MSGGEGPSKMTNAHPEFSDAFAKFRQIRPLATLIGTHLDELESPDQKLLEIDEEIKKIVEPFGSVVCNDQSGKCFFPVNNLHGTEEIDIGPLRKFINEIFDSHFKESELPVHSTWVILNIILRNFFHIADWKDCIQIGEYVGLNEEDVEFCVWYLSSCVGSLIHYTDIPDDEDDWFKNHVLCSPQVIFDSISEFIVTPLRLVDSDKPMVANDRKAWLNKGQFSLEIINKFCKNVDETKHIPAEKLIKLLQHLNLLSPIKSSDPETGRDITTYLMPAVLESVSEDQLSTPDQPDEDRPASLHITFETDYVPTGLFCTTVTKLISEGPKSILGLKWTLVEEGVKRNRFSFNVHDVAQVTLISHSRSLEIRLSRTNPDTSVPEISLHDICSCTLSVFLYLLNSLHIFF